MGAWQLGPVLRGIRGHRAAAALVVFQLGIGLAIAVLAVLIGDYFAHRNVMTLGAKADDLAFVDVQHRSAVDPRDVVARVRRIPGVESATAVEGLPLWALERPTDDVRRIAGAPPVAVSDLEASEGFVATSGLTLAAGHDFTRDDLVTGVAVPALISSALASELWPGESPLGARFVSRAHGPAIVVGVLAPAPRNYLLGDSNLSVIYASVKPRAHTVVLARSQPGRGESTRAALRTDLVAPGQHVGVLDAEYHVLYRYGSVASVLAILATLVGTILIVICIGSMGLTYYLVSRRTREIGVRRALGATRGDVVRYFVVENVILTLAGVVLGLIVLGIVLPRVFYEQEAFEMSWPLVIGSIAIVVVLNLIATLIPARKAATVPPVVASRSA